MWKEDERKCEKCKSGFYSFNKDDEICFDCPEHSMCDTNGSFINVLSGYWRSGYFSSNIYKCYINEACIGEDSCAEGYEGPLCNTCAISNSEKFYKNSSNKCESCNKAAASYAIFGIVR